MASLLTADITSVEAKGGRVALVIGNSSYASAGDLDNPVHDATDMAAALKELGFEVMVGTDLKLDDMRKAVLAFSKRLEGADVSLLYYAGHAIQFADKNYLVPTDAALRHIRDVELGLLELDLVIAQMERETGTRIVILDACRNNPLAESLADGLIPAQKRRLGKGLAQVAGGAGTFVAFATMPGEYAYDGVGERNSPFTRSLKQHIATAGIRIGDMMIEVRKEVIATTKQRQIPTATDTLVTAFYFKEIAPDNENSPTLQPAAAPNLAKIAWDEVRIHHKPDFYREYIAAFPNTIYAKLAQGHLDELARSSRPSRNVVALSSQPPGRGGDRPRGALPSATMTETRPLPVMEAEKRNSPLAATSSGAHVFRDCPDCPLMSSVPAGTFNMGSPESELGRQLNEGPQRLVSVYRTFAMGVYEVSVAEYAKCVTAGACKPPQRSNAISTPSSALNDLLNSGRAAVNVSWNDARAYAAWLSERTKARYYIPSEAEWEYAARAGASSRFSWGDNPEQALVQCSGCGNDMSRPTAAIIGQKDANAFGLYDMHGNVWEWVADCWHKTYHGAPLTHRPWLEENSGECTRRVLRGGSWANGPSQLRSAYRLAGNQTTGGDLIGFRVARVEPEMESIAEFIDKTYLSGTQATSNDVTGMFCDVVDYYDRERLPLAKVVEDKLRYFRRFPFRRYTLIPGTLQVERRPESDTIYRVRFRYTYRVATQKIPDGDLHPGANTANSELIIKIENGRFRVCGENGKVERN